MWQWLATKPTECVVNGDNVLGIAIFTLAGALIGWAIRDLTKLRNDK